MCPSILEQFKYNSSSNYSMTANLPAGERRVKKYSNVCVYDLSQMWAPNMSFIKVIALYGFMQSCYLLDCFTCGLSDVPSLGMFSLMITASQFC